MKNEKINDNFALGFLISNAFNDYTHYLNNYFKEIDLSLSLSLSQARVLLVLAHKEHVSIDYLSEKTNISKSSITKSVKILEKKDFVTKKIDPIDNRKKVIDVTDKGKIVQKKALLINNQMEEKLKNKLGEKEINSLKYQLKKLVDLINSIEYEKE